ncbi:MAG TPA: hypothetical protein VNA12_00710 [Mycobacteriales bacterium]|nr:hypothetical protein [Mycobacteriales bacterium]
MSRDLLTHGRDERPARARATASPWVCRPDRPTRVLASAALVVAAVGAHTVRTFEPAPPTPVLMRTASAQGRAPGAAALSARAVISADGSFIVSPISRPSAPAARRAAELVMSKQCTNIERPRFRLVRGSPRGLSATFVIGRATETPQKHAGFQLRLTWDEGRYVGVVTEAYGGCLAG